MKPNGSLAMADIRIWKWFAMEDWFRNPKP